MQKTIRDSTYSFGFDHYELQKMSLYLEMREGKPVDFADFCYLVGFSNKKNRLLTLPFTDEQMQRISSTGISLQSGSDSNPKESKNSRIQ